MIHIDILLWNIHEYVSFHDEDGEEDNFFQITPIDSHTVCRGV